MQAAKANRGPTVGDLIKTVEFVKLFSTDDKVFYLNCDVACQSKLLLEEMKKAPKEENTEVRVIRLDLNAKTLETVVKYLHYRIINSRLAVTDRKKFDIEPKDALDLLNAAIYMQCWEWFGHEQKLEIVLKYNYFRLKFQTDLLL